MDFLAINGTGKIPFRHVKLKRREDINEMKQNNVPVAIILSLVNRNLD